MEFKIFNRISEIEQSAWQQIVPPDFPFADYRFLLALERSGSVGLNAGWPPHYLTAWEDKALVGAMIFYEKRDSYGEYIFDWEWAALVQQFRLPYYPKLLSAIPFTPATGPKILTRTRADFERIASALLAEARKQVLQLKMHSVHVLFIEPNEQRAFEESGFAIRLTHQFHWQNHDYASFQDFLGEFARKKRQNIVHERAAIKEQALRIELLTGAQLRPEHADWMYQFYLGTIEKNGAMAYLTHEFFREIFETFNDSILLCLAFHESECVAGSIFFIKGKVLYGRYWGAKKEFKCLHFELCYYQGIEFAIAQRLDRFEAGAQGPHKINRGFLPAYTYSAHWFSEPRLQQIIAELVEEEKKALRRGFKAFEAHTPFKSSSNS